MKINRLLAALCLLALFTASVPMANAVEIVRLQMEYGGVGTGNGTATGGFGFEKVTKTLDLELFDVDQNGVDIAPLTVANFLNYVNRGDYDGMFIHRSAPGFVLQAGGYTFTPADPVNDPLDTIVSGTGLAKVLEDAPVVNEFSLSNIRGTIAMAKLGGDPDSATSQWFINLADNSANLDAQNGGFTVFGSIIDNGMTIADEVATFPAYNSSGVEPALSALPVADFDPGIVPVESVFQENLVMITSAAQITRPIVRFTPASVDFGLDLAGDATGQTAVMQLKNTGNEALDVTTIDVVAPYSIQSENCLNATLDPVSISPASSCTIDLVFSPTVVGVFTDSVTIGYTGKVGGESFSVAYDSFGEGIKPQISVPSLLDVGLAQVNQTILNSFTVANTGTKGLFVNDISIVGADAALFNVFNLCPTLASGDPALDANGTCFVVVEFTPVAEGSRTATLVIESNDLDNPIVNVDLIASTGVTIIQVASTFDVGLAQVGGFSARRDLIVQNIGVAPLDVSSITITGATGFSETNDCVSVPASGTCAITIKYTATSFGQVSETLTINSNDPANPNVEVVITGLGQGDIDGVSDSVERAAPGQGDGNNDEIKDDIQNNVTSFVAKGGQYVTLVSDDAIFATANGLDGTTVLDSVVLVDVEPAGAPEGLFFDLGLYNFNVFIPRFLPNGEVVRVGLYFPVDATPDVYMRYGPTPDDPTPHWYDFSFISTGAEEEVGTGANVIGRVTVTSPSGIDVEKNLVILTFWDGKRGDDDLTINGKIVHGVGGVSFNQQAAASEESVGSAAYLWFAVLILMTGARRLRGRSGCY